MFKTHQPIIAAACIDSPKTFINAAAFAIISARMTFSRAVDDAADYSAGKRKGLQSIFAWKHRALDDLEKEAEQRRTLLASRRPSAALSAILRSWHGYGLAKGGFVIQMVTGQAGCIDSRNLDYFDVDARQVRNPVKPSVLSADRHAQAYIKLCKELGGSEYLWNVWCEYMASTTTRYEWKDDPFAVSAAHCHAIGLSLPSTVQQSTTSISDIPF